MIFDRLDGSRTNLPSQNPAGILRQAGLDITMEDNVATIDFTESGGYSAAGKYREQFLQMRSEGMKATRQSGAVVEIEVDQHSFLGNFTHVCAAVLGKAIQSGDTLGQRADEIIGKLADKQVEATQRPGALPAVAGGSGFAISSPGVEM